jgi:hypothetical protein
MFTNALEKNLHPSAKHCAEPETQLNVEEEEDISEMAQQSPCSRR